MEGVFSSYSHKGWMGILTPRTEYTGGSSSKSELNQLCASWFNKVQRWLSIAGGSENIQASGEDIYGQRLSKAIINARTQTPWASTSYCPALIYSLGYMPTCANLPNFILHSRLLNITWYPPKYKYQQHLQVVDEVLQHSLKKKVFQILWLNN